MKGMISYQDFVGNSIADILAVVASEHLQAPRLVQEHCSMVVGAAYLICHRIALVEEACWSSAPSILPPAPPSKVVRTSAKSIARTIHDRSAAVGHELVRRKCSLSFG